MPPRPSNRRNRSVSLDPKALTLAELNALPRNSLILLALARNLVTTGTKTRLAQRIYEHEKANNHTAQADDSVLPTPPALNDNLEVDADAERPSRSRFRQQQASGSLFSRDQLSQLRGLIAEAVGPQLSGFNQADGLPADVPLLSPASPVTNARNNASQQNLRNFIQDGVVSQSQLVRSPPQAPQVSAPLLGTAATQSDLSLPPLPDKLRAKISKHLSVSSPRSSSRCRPNSCPGVSEDPLADRLAFLQSRAIADSTRRSYQAGIRRYSTFCASRGWRSFPATETTLRFFAAYLADSVSFKTIKLYMAGIRFAHTENSLPDPFQEAPLLHLLLRGIKRTVGLTSRQRLPVTMTLLRQIKEELARAPDILPSDKLMLWSAFTLAFYGFLRSSEFTAPSATQFNQLVHLSNTDVSFTPEGCLTLHLKSSKTDPYRQGCSLLIAPSHHSVCAVRALRKYLALHPTRGASPLYVFESGHYLTRAKVTTILRTLLQRLGISTELYASHSFRIGAATSAAEVGLPPWLIQTLGRWSSNCFTLYIRTPPSLLQKVPSMLAASSTKGQGIWNPLQGRYTPSFP